jgi:hypothetical protein
MIAPIFCAGFSLCHVLTMISIFGPGPRRSWRSVRAARAFIKIQKASQKNMIHCEVATSRLASPQLDPRSLSKPKGPSLCFARCQERHTRCRTLTVARALGCARVRRHCESHCRRVSR